MFKVFAVSYKKCKEKARKDINKMREKDPPKTAEEYEAKLIELADEMYKKDKPSPVSAELSTPTLVKEYIELCRNQGGFKHLIGMRKMQKEDKKGNKLVSKRTKRPLWQWVMLEPNYEVE